MPYDLEGYRFNNVSQNGGILDAATHPNISLITRADSPMYLSTIALDTTLRKFASILDAMALARSVFPVPTEKRRN